MAMKKWNDLSARSRRLILAAGVFEAVLKLAALIDLARRPAGEIRGSKMRWALAVTLLNSGGIAPIAYFTYGRRRS
jgi:hypothetical protein